MATKSKSQQQLEKATATASVALGDVVRTAVQEVLGHVEVGDIIAEFDPGWSKEEVANIAKAAADYLIDQLLGGLCYNALDPKKFGETMINSAFDQLQAANETAGRFPSPSADSQVDGRTQWVTQQLIQKRYRGSIIPLVTGSYYHVVEKPYTLKKAASNDEKSRTQTKEAAARLLAARKKFA